MNFTAKVLSIIKSPQFKRVCGSVFGFVLLFFGTVFIPNMLFFIPRFHMYSNLMIGEHNDIVEIGTALISMPMLFCALVYTVSGGDCLLYDKWNHRPDASVSMLSFVLTQPVFYIKSAVFALIYLLMPSVKLFPALYAALDKLNIESFDLLAKIILLILLFVIALCATVSAMRKWDKSEDVIKKM